MICNHIFFSSKKVDQSFAKSIEQTFKFIIAPSRIEIDFGCVLQKFHLSALWWLRRQDVQSALLTEILKYLVKVLTRTILVVKPGQHRVDDDCFPICLIGQIGCSRSSAPFVCEIIRPHHPSRTQNPDTMPGLRANSTSQHPPSGRRVQNVPELDAHRGCLNRVLLWCSGLQYIATVCLRLFVQKLHRKLHTLIH